MVIISFNMLINQNFMKEGTYYGRNKWFKAY